MGIAIRRDATLSWIFSVGLATMCAFLAPVFTQAQVRGVYPFGMNATNSGVTPEAGITYANLFVFFSRDEKKGSHGEVLATEQNSIMMDLNSFVWVSEKKLTRLGGAIFSASATLPAANNSLTSDVQGPLSGGGGFADSFYQPLILGWRSKRAGQTFNLDYSLTRFFRCRETCVCNLDSRGTASGKPRISAGQPLQRNRQRPITMPTLSGSRST